MILQEPVWLLLTIPVFVSLWLMKSLTRLTQGLRIVSMIALILALCSPVIVFPSRRGTVVIVADRSSSMPAGSESRMEEIIDLVYNKKDARDQLGVVSFGDQPLIEHAAQHGAFQGFTGKVNPDGSNLTEAMQTALALIPPESPGRILVLSDGRWTGQPPASAISTAMSRQIPVDFRLLQRPGAMDLAIAQIQSPSQVNPRESYMITAWLQSPISQEVTYQLRSGTRIIAHGSRQVPAGQSRLTFRDQAPESGTLQYTLQVQAAGQDPVPENNSARVLIGIQGEKPVVCLTGESDSGLADLLRRSGLNVLVQTPWQMEYSLERLSGIQGLIIEDLPANTIGAAGMENIAQWVTKTGTGLMTTGGKNAYGPGGYFKSPLEPIMPVSMELRREHRKLSLAIVVALDRSGSMGAPVGLGKTKMDLANLATVEVLDLLSPTDQFGVIAVDSSAHLIMDLSDVSDASLFRNRILQIESMGGGIFVYEALSNAAAMIAKAEPQTKHIILFADAADSEEPGNYRQLLAECANAGITVSVIGLGKPTDGDAPLLEEIAVLGQGRIFFTESPEELPRLFAQDTFVVARSSFLEEPTPVDVLASMLTITGSRFEIPQTVGGYNLCYLRPGAMLGAVSMDEYQAPIVAAWQSGIGRILCYTPQADGPYTGDIVRWPQFGSFLSSIVRWVAGQQGQFGDQMALTQQVVSGSCRIRLYLDPDREKQIFSKAPSVTTLYGYATEAPQTRTAEMAYLNADTLTVEFPLQGARTYLSTIEIPGFSPVTLPPVTLPYSPEFHPADRHSGISALVEIAQATGGAERIDVSEIWADLPPKKQMASLTPWLISLAILLFLLEIFQRRTGLLSSLKWDIALAGKVGRRIKTVRGRRLRPAKKKAAKAAFAEEKPETVQTPAAAAKTPEPEQERELFDALSRARQKAQSRTRRE